MASSSVVDKPTTGYLKKIIGAPVGEMIPLYNKDVSIGRTKECDVRCRDPNVSRSHCILSYSPDGWSITDLGGINGTYLDRDHLKSHVPHPLKDGMGIYLGPPSDAPIAFVFIKSKNTEEVSNKAKETLQSKDVSPQSDNSVELKSTQSNLKKRSNPANYSSPNKKHAPSTSDHQPASPPISSRQLARSATSRPRPVSTDSDNLSDVSICSTDSLRTRIRKMNSHKKKKHPSNVIDGVNVASTSASPPLRSFTSNFDSVPSTSSANQAPKVKKKSKTSEGLKNMKKTIPGAYRELETLFHDETDSLTDSVNDREDSESLLTNSTLLDNANSSTLPQGLTISNEAVDTTLTDKIAQKEKMKDQLKRAKARLKLNEDEEKKKLEIEASTSKKDTSEKLCDMLEEELICNICTEVFIKATTLGCSHTFCEHCITLWKKKQKRCPICREMVTSQTRILIMDNFIDKVVEKLDKDYQDKRKEVIAAREAAKANEKVKKPKKKKASWSRNPRGSGSNRTGNIRNYLENVPYDTIRHMALYPVEHYPFGVPVMSSGSEMDDDAYCYICGGGHYSTACPTI